MAVELPPIECYQREQVGTKRARRLRRQGMVPAILHSTNQQPRPVALLRRDVEFALAHGRHLLEVTVDGQPAKLLIREVQYDHLGTTPIHLDLSRVSLSDRVQVTVPLELRGTATGVKEGGVLEQQLVELEIEVLVTQIPETLRVNVNDLGLNESIHVRDIPVPQGVKVLTRADELVASVSTVAEEEAAEAEPESAEPEVIGRAKEEGEEAPKGS